MAVTIGSFNLHGWNQGSPYLKNLCNVCDIIMVQEHWLLPQDLVKFNDFDAEFIGVSSSAMSVAIGKGILRGRPYGGIGALVNKKIASQFKCVAISERYMAIIVGNLLMFNVYFPNCVDIEIYMNAMTSLLTDIRDLINRNRKLKVVICGDFNFEFVDNHAGCLLVKQLMADFNLTLCDDLYKDSNVFTYRNFALNQFSCIDHCIVDDTIRSDILSVEIVDSGINLSDHVPVIIKFNYNCVMEVAASLPRALAPKCTKYRWDKVDTYCYYNATREGLSAINTDDGVSSPAAIDALYDSIVLCLQDASAAYIPRTTGDFYKFWWDNNLSDLKAKSIDAHNLWKDSGRPRSGVVFDIMKSAKAIYKRALRHKDRGDFNVVSNDLNDCLLGKDHTAFWKTWKANFTHNGHFPDVIDGSSDPSLIANKFASIFEAACSPNSQAAGDRLFNEFVNSYNEFIASDNHEVFSDISVELIDWCTRSMKLHKAAGIDGIEVEHLLHAHPIVCLLLCRLFNAMLQCGHVPRGFHYGIIIPVVKDPCGDISNANNYRGITLSPTISKLFEMCIMNKFGHLLVASDLQFGFRKFLGCSNAIFTVQSVVDYFVKHGSTVNVCTLDMSKAFDKVNHNGLYIKLMKHRVPPALLHVLIDWYSKSCAFVRWNGALSSCFELLCGVRQGGVLSPVLFTLYVDDIIVKLRSARLGCSIHNVYVGCVMYADDLVLIASSISTMQSMVNICAGEMAYLDMRFNVAKSSVMRIGKRYKHQCVSLTVCGDTLQFVALVKYLGVYIISGLHFMVDISKLKSKFYAALNGILSKCRGRDGMSDMVTMHLINTFCRPLLLYGCDSIPMCKSYVASLTHSWNHIYWKLFEVNDRECIADIQFFMNDISIPDEISRRREKFLTRVKFSNNAVMLVLIDTM
jgi:exonuclease III